MFYKISFLSDAFTYQRQNKDALRIKLQILLPSINIKLLEAVLGGQMDGWMLRICLGYCSGKIWRFKRFNFICLIQWLLDPKTHSSASVRDALVSRNSVALCWAGDSTKGWAADARLLLWKTTTEIGFWYFEVLWFFLESDILFLFLCSVEIKSQWSECLWEDRGLCSGVTGRISRF